ncbi:MAG: toll/interleukin-1 receptor domain-containing protein, partial [Caulobacteraceae bacterium]|nr:toll/interleukin-1 receptor domain-containing protein [Caulobacteraceae bacterium]
LQPDVHLFRRRRRAVDWPGPQACRCGRTTAESTFRPDSPTVRAKQKKRAVTDIFLSYNREDQARAKLFAEAFEGQGYRVWWDVGLRTGEAYDEVTEAALRQARAVVVLWSKRSAASRWVRAEATLADRNRTLVPCMIEPCERPIMFELTQTAELSHWWGDLEDPAWRRFLDDLRLKFGDADPPAPIASPPLAGGPAPQAAKPPPQTNLAAGGAALIGRAEDSAALCAALKTHRLVTISGPGGGGKSRLANAVAWLALPDFPDGVWWVELAPVTEGALVADAIARQDDRLSLAIVPTTLLSSGEIAGRFRPAVGPPRPDGELFRELGLDPVKSAEHPRIVFVSPAVCGGESLADRTALAA